MIWLASPAARWFVATLAAGQTAILMWLIVRQWAPRQRAMLLLGLLAMIAAAFAVLPTIPIPLVGLTISGGCHAIAYASLLGWFAASLRPNREPAVTALARRIRRTMSPKVIRYTRQATVGWCVFFAAQLGISADLLIFAPTEMWSSFVNVLNLPLLAVMIGGEFACRQILIRNEPRTGLFATLSVMRHARSGSP